MEARKIEEGNPKKLKAASLNYEDNPMRQQKKGKRKVDQVSDQLKPFGKDNYATTN